MTTRTFKVASAEFTREGALKAWLIRHRGDPNRPRKFKVPKIKYVPGMSDSVSVFYPKPGHRQRRLAYRTFRQPGIEADPPD